MAASYANQSSLPMVVDAVGVTASPIRKGLVRDLLDYSPTVLKGNMSEIRSLVGLKHHGVGSMRVLKIKKLRIYFKS